MNVHICVPGSGRGPFLAYLAQLAIHTVQAGIEINITSSRSSDLIALRTRLVGTALTSGATHLLLLDDDVLVPSDCILRMLEHDVDVVVGNYVKKDMSYTPVAANGLDEPVLSIGLSGTELIMTAGLGCVFIKASVFDRIQFPWFGYRWFHTAEQASVSVGVPDYSQWRGAGEDTWFFGRLADAGIKVFVDHALSHNLVHWGECGWAEDGLVLA